MAICITACGDGDYSNSAAEAPYTDRSAPPSPNGGAASVVRQISLNEGDLPKGWHVDLIPGGEQVRGEVTLANCGYMFSSEKHRVARRQVQAQRGHELTGISNEVVIYDSPANARAALQEWRSSVELCDLKAYHASGVQNVPDVRYAESTTTSDSTLPVRENTVTHQTITYRGVAQSYYRWTILQVRGPILDITYLGYSREPSGAELAFGISLCRKTGSRLASVKV